MVKKKLFIEGTTNDTNGDLAMGFTALFKQKLDKKMPQIIMADGKTTAIDKFKNTLYPVKPNETIDRFLLVDLDGQEDKRNTDIQNNDLTTYVYKTPEEKDKKQRCFYMIQEMETWFISQAETVLDIHYKTSVSVKLVKKSAVQFNNPDEELDKHLKPLGKQYHKVKDGVRMLKMLNLDKLMIDFPDVKNLVEELQKA